MRQDDVDLHRRARDGDPAALDVIVERYLPLARKLAARFQRPEEQFDDLVQVAALGLVLAVQRYDPGRGTSFSTFAVPTIMGELRRHFRDRAWSVRVPRPLQERLLRVTAVSSALSRETGRSPTVAEVALAAGLSEEDVLEAMQAGTAYRAASLEAPVEGGDGDRLGDLLGTGDDAYGLAEDRAVLDPLMDGLSKRDRLIVRLRFEEDLTQDQIARRVGLSQMQVSRVLRRSLMRMQSAAEPAVG